MKTPYKNAKEYEGRVIDPETLNEILPDRKAISSGPGVLVFEQRNWPSGRKFQVVVVRMSKKLLIREVIY